MTAKTHLNRISRNELMKKGIEWFIDSPKHFPTLLISDQVLCGNDRARDFVDTMKNNASRLYNIELSDLEVASLLIDILLVVSRDVNYDILPE